MGECHTTHMILLNCVAKIPASIRMQRANNAASTLPSTPTQAPAVCREIRSSITPKLMLRRCAVLKAAMTKHNIPVAVEFFIMVLSMDFAVGQMLYGIQTHRHVAAGEWSQRNTVTIFVVVVLSRMVTIIPAVKPRDFESEIHITSAAME